MTDDEIFKIWDAWLGIIEVEVRDLLALRHVFWEVQKIIRANRRIQKPSAFYRWMGATYSASISVGIRRQLDERQDSVSLVRLLADIAKRPRVLSRERYRLVRGDPSALADPEFDGWAGPGQRFAPASQVQDDLDRLKTQSEAIKEYASKKVAHVDETGPSNVPSFNDIDKRLDLLEESVKRYRQRLRGIAPMQLLPRWPDDWKDVFREPWIP
jgi:hypothetical protein